MRETIARFGGVAEDPGWFFFHIFVVRLLTSVFCNDSRRGRDLTKSLRNILKIRRKVRSSLRICLCTYYLSPSLLDTAGGSLGWMVRGSMVVRYTYDFSSTRKITFAMPGSIPRSCVRTAAIYCRQAGFVAIGENPIWLPHYHG